MNGRFVRFVNGRFVYIIIVLFYSLVVCLFIINYVILFSELFYDLFKICLFKYIRLFENLKVRIWGSKLFNISERVLYFCWLRRFLFFYVWNICKGRNILVFIVML